MDASQSESLPSPCPFGALQEELLSSVEGQLHGIEQTLQNLQEAVRTRSVYDALRMGRDALSQITSSLSLSEVKPSSLFSVIQL